MIEVSHAGGMLTIQGHANKPNDFTGNAVCEGMSILVQTYIAGLQYLTDEKVSYSRTKGYAAVADPRTPEGYILLQSCLIGIDMLSGAYPDHFRIDGNLGIIKQLY